MSVYGSTIKKGGMSVSSGLNFDTYTLSEVQLQNVDRINNALYQSGVDLEGNITKDEISIFLDQNSTNGNFNQALKEKIFKALYNENITEIPDDKANYHYKKFMKYLNDINFRKILTAT